MEESPISYSTTIVSHDNFEDEDPFQLKDLNMLFASDSILEGLNESRSELCSRVKNLKKDLHDWQDKLDIEVNSYDDDVGDLKLFFDSNIEQLTDEFEELKNTLKEQLEVATSKLVELDTSVADCAQYLEGLNSNCEFEKSLFNDLIADLKIQNNAEGEKPTTIDHSNLDTTVNLEEVQELLDKGSFSS